MDFIFGVDPDFYFDESEMDLSVNITGLVEVIHLTKRQAYILKNQWLEKIVVEAGEAEAFLIWCTVFITIFLASIAVTIVLQRPDLYIAYMDNALINHGITPPIHPPIMNETFDSLRKTKVQIWTAADAHPFLNNDFCVICLDEFSAEDSIRILPCSHGFHMACVDPWITKLVPSCPICKQSLVETGPLELPKLPVASMPLIGTAAKTGFSQQFYILHLLNLLQNESCVSIESY